MANYRQIHTQIWQDNWFLDLNTSEKLLFIYLFSNDRTSLSGLYELHKRTISFETALKSKEVDTILNRFERDGKLYYRDGVVWIVNMKKYHPTKSDSVLIRIMQDVEEVPECELKRRYLEHEGVTEVFSDEDTPSTPCKTEFDTVGTEGVQGVDTVGTPGSQLKGIVIIDKEEVLDKEESLKEKVNTAESENLPTYSENPTQAQFCRFYKNEVGKLPKKDEEVIGSLVGVFKEKDFQNAVLHMKSATPNPNASYLKTILDNWYRDHKIQKVYGL